MKSSSNVYDTLIQILGQHKHWLDKRHLYTLTWMIVGLIESKTISLPEWATYVNSRAMYAQSTVRRFSRWLHNSRIEVHSLYDPIIQEALRQWEGKTIYLALDTSMLWDRYCHIRLCVVYRGRAIPLVWKTIEHASSTVSLASYQALLDKAATLLPLNSTVILLADRGFADTNLMAYLSQTLDWHWRIRIKSSFLVYRHQAETCKIKQIQLDQGQARFWHTVYITKKRFGAVHLAMANPRGLQETWLIVSDQLTDVTTFDEYGLRFSIEENFLDDKSNGFQLESSLLRCPSALSRLCLVLALTTLVLVCQGTVVVAENKRRWVDAHWSRGNSYLKIGWKWIRRACIKGYELISQLRLSPLPDPEPAIASRKQARERDDLRFSVQFEVFSPYPSCSS